MQSDCSHALKEASDVSQAALSLSLQRYAC